MSTRRIGSVVGWTLLTLLLVFVGFQEPEAQASSAQSSASYAPAPHAPAPKVATVAKTATANLPEAPVRDELLAALQQEAPTLSTDVLERAVDAMRCAVASSEAERDEILTVIDYSLPSTEKRLWVFDVASRELLFHELVAHGKNTGGDMATKFSNINGSLQSSLGLFRTAETYYGKNGYSMRLHGLEPGINDLALPRTIVMHGAWYVSRELADKQGRIGRSWGCPAVRDKVARPLIDTIKDGSLLFSYYPDENWLGGSKYLQACGTPTPQTAVSMTAE